MSGQGGAPSLPLGFVRPLSGSFPPFSQRSLPAQSRWCSAAGFPSLAHAAKRACPRRARTYTLSFMGLLLPPSRSWRNSVCNAFVSPSQAMRFLLRAAEEAGPRESSEPFSRGTEGAGFACEQMMYR
jgi:hypothetical protein